MIKCKIKKCKERIYKALAAFLSASAFLLLFSVHVQANPVSEKTSENIAENAVADTAQQAEAKNVVPVIPHEDQELDIVARSSFRTLLAAMGGEMQERYALFVDGVNERYTDFMQELRDEYVLKLIPQAPQKEYTTEVDSGIVILRSSISSGDSLGSLLNGWITLSAILNIVDESKDIYPLTSLKVGKPFALHVNLADNALEKFEYELDDSHKVVISCSGDAYSVAFEEIKYDYELNYLEGSVVSNFFNAVTGLGEGAVFAIRLADVFTYDIDFAREIKEGDTFRALVEKKYRDGKFTGYGRILAAQFVNNGTTYEAFLYHDSEDDEKLSYFNRKGEALQKAFLRTPVHFTRISSRFTMSRKHPILGVTRAHPGIDYAAPKGTPVMAVGDGTVIRAAYTGGYGHLIILKHRGAMETQYAHLSGYAKGIKRGAKVSQGQVIGYVGSTGLSTGPHLDFRIKKDGNFVNPDKVIVPSKPPLRKEQMEGFGEAVQEMDLLLQSKKSLDDFDTVNWLGGIR